MEAATDSAAAILQTLQRDYASVFAWNCTIQAFSSEDIGRSIATQGIYDLPVTEAIYRLADPGETLLDAGANSGYMTLVLAALGRSWRAGTVF